MNWILRLLSKVPLTIKVAVPLIALCGSLLFTTKHYRDALIEERSRHKHQIEKLALEAGNTVLRVQQELILREQSRRDERRALEARLEQARQDALATNEQAAEASIRAIKEATDACLSVDTPDIDFGLRKN